MEQVNQKAQIPNVVGTVQCKVEVTVPQETNLENEHVAMRNAIIKFPQFNTEFAKKHPLRILIAEDSMVNVKVALWFLKKLGYKPDVAFNGVEVLDALNRRSYDVIFMDVEMPEMDGIETTIAIRQSLPIDKQPHIIAMTANTGEGDKETYLSAGMNDYITKPLKIDEIVQLLIATRPLPDFLDELYSANFGEHLDRIAV